MKSIFKALVATIGVAYAAKGEDEVTQIPATNGTMINMPTPTYSGYLNVTDTKKLHYVFVESKNDSTNDPLVIWFNGGPGCSSLLGLMQEHGPFIIDDGETELKENPYPWNNASNVLYIESPAGVGYSLANDTNGDFAQNDMLQSQDAFTAMEAWFAEFPEFLPNKLFVTGESYGGIYVPYLTWQIYQNNLQQAFDTTKTKYNIAGFAVGNGATNWDFDVSPSFPETVVNFQLVPQRMLDQFNEAGCVYYFNDFRPHNGTSDCDDLWSKI